MAGLRVNHFNDQAFQHIIVNAGELFFGQTERDQERADLLRRHVFDLVDVCDCDVCSGKRFKFWLRQIFISCHRGVRKVKPVDEELEYDTYDIDLPFTKKVSLASMLIAESDMVVYGKKNITLAKGKTKTKAMGDDSRILVTQGTPTVAAKFRGNAPEEIPMSWEELKKYL